MKPWFPSKRPLLIGVVHLLPLPGSPRWGGDWPAVLRRAVADAQAYAAGGADALEVENYGDVPFTKGSVAAETLAAMAVAGRAIGEAVRIPVGFNVLRNDAGAALALCTACGGRFIRVNVHTGAMLTDQGLIEGQAYETLRRRQRLCPEVRLFADVHVKHAVPLGPVPLEQAARDTWHRGLADALILSGAGTGLATDVEEVRRVRAACPGVPLLIGSGITVENVASFRPWADGFIVGTSLKRGGRVEAPVEVRRVRALKRALAGIG